MVTLRLTQVSLCSGNLDQVNQDRLNTHQSRFGFTPKTGMAFPETGFSFYCVDNKNIRITGNGAAESGLPEAIFCSLDSEFMEDDKETVGGSTLSASQRSQRSQR